MAENSKIEWTEATWNALAGCTEISPGCANCYAAVMAHRLAAMGQAKYKGTTKKLANGKVVWNGKVNLDEEALRIPLKRKKPTTYFVNSMSDLFHEDVPEQFISQSFAVMALCLRHRFQVLTKRPERMLDYVSRLARTITPLEEIARDLGYTFNFQLDGRKHPLLPWPIPSVWLGVSVEDRARKDRIDVLRQVPAAIRFLSLEPLLEDLGSLDLTGIHWVIVGHESGHNRRPGEASHTRAIIQQCQNASVPVFNKQMQIDGRLSHNPTDWPLDLRIREFPKGAIRANAS